MKLSEWIEISSTEELRKLAWKAGCHPNYLYSVAFAGCSPALAKAIETATRELTPDKVVTKEEIRPDVWDEE